MKSNNLRPALSLLLHILHRHILPPFFILLLIIPACVQSRSFICPEIGSIVFNPETKRWQAELTDGTPEFWNLWVSEPKPQQAEYFSGVRSLSPTHKFVSARIDVNTNGYFNSDSDSDSVNSKPDYLPSCHYGANIRERISIRLMVLILNPESLFPDIASDLTFLIFKNSDAWEDLGHCFFCRRHLPTCVFYIPQVSIRLATAGYAEEPDKDSIKLQLCGLFDYDKSGQGNSSHEPVNITAYATADIQYHSKPLDNLHNSDVTRLLIIHNHSIVYQLPLVEPADVMAGGTDNELQKNLPNLFDLYIKPDSYTVIDVIIDVINGPSNPKLLWCHHYVSRIFSLVDSKHDEL